MEDVDIKVGHSYNSRTGRSSDREVVWRSASHVQYDSDSVRWGSSYPIVTLERFLRWAGADIDVADDEGG